MPEGAAIAGDGYALVVPTPPAFFRQRYGVPDEVLILGPYTGGLDNAGESLKLRKPGWCKRGTGLPERSRGFCGREF